MILLSKFDLCDWDVKPVVSIFMRNERERGTMDYGREAVEEGSRGKSGMVEGSGEREAYGVRERGERT